MTFSSRKLRGIAVVRKVEFSTSSSHPRGAVRNHRFGCLMARRFVALFSIRIEVFVVRSESLFTYNLTLDLQTNGQCVVLSFNMNAIVDEGEGDGAILALPFARSRLVAKQATSFAPLARNRHLDFSRR